MSESSKKSGKPMPPPTKEPFPASKSIFVENVPISAESADLVNFFESAGEVVDHIIYKDSDGKLLGLATVEFATSEAAKKAMELHGKELLGNKILLDVETDGGDTGDFYVSDPIPGGRDSYDGKAAVLHGFSKDDDEDKELFEDCEIPKIYFPKNPDGSLRGFAYLDFLNVDALKEALDLTGSKVGESTLYIDGPIELPPNNLGSACGDSSRVD